MSSSSHRQAAPQLIQWQDPEDDHCVQCWRKLEEEEQIDTSITYTINNVEKIFICTTCPECYDALFEEANSKNFSITNNY